MKEKSIEKGLFVRGGVYWLRYSLNGKQYRETTKIPVDSPTAAIRNTNKKNALTLLAKRQQEVLQGVKPEIKATPVAAFGELKQAYFTWLAGQEKAGEQKAAITKRIIFGRLEKHFGGSTPLTQITAKAVEAYKSKLVEAGKKPATCNRYLALLKHALGKAVEWEMVSEDTVRAVRRIKLYRENNARLRFLSQDECQALIKACSSSLRPIVTLALNTGMRKGEILGLTWKHVDLNHGFILLDKTKNGGRREIPINDTAREVLETAYRGTKEQPRRLDVPWVFYKNTTGERLRSVHAAFLSACKKAGIEDFHFHDLRHSFASHLVMAGADLLVVKELLGHKSLNMTLRYAHLAPSHKVKAVQLLNSLTGNSEEKRVTYVLSTD